MTIISFSLNFNASFSLPELRMSSLCAHTGDYLSVEIWRAQLRININLGPSDQMPGDNSLLAGSLLDDGRWHDVRIMRSALMINVSVDRAMVWTDVIGQFYNLDVNQNVRACLSECQNVVCVSRWTWTVERRRVFMYSTRLLVVSCIIDHCGRLALVFGCARRLGDEQLHGLHREPLLQRAQHVPRLLGAGRVACVERHDRFLHGLTGALQVLRRGESRLHNVRVDARVPDNVPDGAGLHLVRLQGVHRVLRAVRVPHIPDARHDDLGAVDRRTGYE